MGDPTVPGVGCGRTTQTALGRSHPQGAAEVLVMPREELRIAHEGRQMLAA